MTDQEREEAQGIIDDIKRFDRQKEAGLKILALMAVVTIVGFIALAIYDHSEGQSARAASPPQQLGPNYVTINGHDMQCVVMQVSTTEFAMSCDWASIKDQ